MAHDSTLIPATFAKSLSDRYQIERELGRGGMALVYLADDLKHGRKVAIKVLLPEAAAAIGRDRFLREIEIAARLTHPHILALHDSGAADGQLYYVMPYIEGESLRARLDREHQLPLEDALGLAREIASALGYAHRHGLIHRDIKPENVLLADGMALVADFGIARAVSATGTKGLTTVGAVVGTPAYMAPEQVMGSSDVDGRADLYALGCLMYEMLAGQPPFTGPVASLAYQHLSAEPRPVSDVRPGVPAAVVTAIAKALAKAPADRHATAAQFAEALVAATTRSPTPAPEPEEGAVPNNLPRQRTRFIGREQELAECTRLLGDTRLLTLTGIGGCGKTRLALKLAAHLLATFPDGVWFVDLAPLQDAERVTLTMATVLGVREEPGTPLIDRLAAHLATRRTLIVLDNCEHVLGAAADLVEAVLGVSADLKLVVTSREGLGIAGEQSLALRSLSVPAASETDSLAIEASEAVRLFMDRARLVEPRFSLEAATAPLVADICRRLDGIPLAIELAAARVKMLSVVEIRARLDDRFRLLTGGSKSALPRHQTLRAAIGWSFDQLSPEEHRLLRQTSVFAGGWTLEGATRVAGEDADEFEVLDLLTRLGEKSLVTPERIAGGSTRYAMLETVRQYAQEQLDGSGEGDETRARHLAFYLALAEEAVSDLHGPEEGASLSRLDRERENLLSAHASCDRAEGGAESGLRLVTAVQAYWVHRGLLELGYRVTVAALARTGGQARTPHRGRSLIAAGQLGCVMGRYDEAQGYLEEGLSIARERGDKGRAATVLRVLGGVSLGLGNRARAREQLDESLALARELGDKRRLAATLIVLAELEREEGDLDAAEQLYADGLALTREFGDRSNIAIALINLAMVSIGRRAGEHARGMLLEAFTIAEGIGSKRTGLAVMYGSEGLAAFDGEWERAARFHGASAAQREQMAYGRDSADEAFLAPLMTRTREALGEAAFAAAEAGGRALTCEQALAETRSWLETVA